MLKICALSIFVGTMLFGAETGKTRFTTMADCKSAVESGEFSNYIPSFLNRHREPAVGEEVRSLEERACVEMDIVGGKGFVPQASGEKFIFSTATGLPVRRYDCGNGVYSLEYIPVPPPPPPPPAPAPVPEPEPPAEEVTLPPAQPPVELNELPPPPDWPEFGQYQVTLTWDKGRKFPIPCWPREKGWYGTGIPIASCIGIGLGIGLPFIGGGHAAIVAIGHKIVPVLGVISPP